VGATINLVIVPTDYDDDDDCGDSHYSDNDAHEVIVVFLLGHQTIARSS